MRPDRFDNIDFVAEPRPICLTHYPSKPLIDAIDSGDVKVILIVEDPIDVVQHLQRSLGLPVMEAIRAQTATAVANRAIGRTQQVHYLYRSTERSAGEVVERLAQELGLSFPGAGRSELMAIAAPGLPSDADIETALSAHSEHYAPPFRSQAGCAVDAQALMAADVVGPLLAMARNDTTRPVVWPTEVFTFVDQPGRPAPRSAEISGPVRNLYYGPYLYLPPGRYRVEAILGFSDEIRDVPFVLEVHGATWLVKARIDEQRAGDYRGYFILDHHEPTATVEIRLRNERGVERGRLSLIELLFFCID